MTEDSVILPNDESIEYHIVTLFHKLETLKNDRDEDRKHMSIQFELRTLELWRAVISECIASFIYVFLVCGAATDAGNSTTISSGIISTALAAGLAVASLTHCFKNISGAHINPAVTFAMGVTKKISLIRTIMFVVAQCGGAIAGAAFLYGVTNPNYQSSLNTLLAHTLNESPWEKFAIEFILSYIVVFSYFVSFDGYHKWMGTSPLMIGATYSACSFAFMPYLNPARSLGPSFVLNRWENEWVHCIAPLLGGILSGLIYEYIFNAKRHKCVRSNADDDDSSSIHFDEDGAYDDLDKGTTVQQPKFHGSNYNNSYRPTTMGTSSSYCPNPNANGLYSTLGTKLEYVEPLYEGTRSLYCRSPPLTRANLNRSQSVYAKTNGNNGNKDLIPKPGPLLPAQSLYPMRLNQAQNQNIQNQMQQRNDNVYGVRPGTMSTRTDKSSDERNSVYGMRTTTSTGGQTKTNYGNGQKQDVRTNVHTSNPNSYHHTLQHSPSLQY